MAARLVIDFGTTNTVVARWSESREEPETLRLPGLSAAPTPNQPSTIPSLVYVLDASKGQVLAGEEVRAGGYDVKNDPRFFSGFKRAIVAVHREPPRVLDGVEVTYEQAGEWFLRRVLEAARSVGEDTREIIATVPVQSFEQYVNWLGQASLRLGVQEMQIVDESTAAALGYDVQRPRSAVLVFDFGGGTLDLSVVRTPEAGRPRGWLVRLGRILGRGEDPNWWDGVALVLGKAAEILGGEDIDTWLLDDALAANGVTRSQVSRIMRQLRLSAEAAKIELSRAPEAEFSGFDPDTFRTYARHYRRSDLEDLLDREGLFGKLQGCLQSALRQAEQQGLRREEIEAVALTGGSSQIPCVQRAVRQNFPAERVRLHKPFEAVAHGALRLMRDTQVEDFLYHSYGVRGYNSDTGRHDYDLIVSAGQKLPLTEPVVRRYRCSTVNQREVELPVGEIDHGSQGAADVIIERGRLVTAPAPAVSGSRYALVPADQVRPVNARTAVVRLNPPGQPGPERFECRFTVDRRRTLRVTVLDLLQPNRPLLREEALVEVK
jgi:molecular chaperone DnaK (HSP70)